MEASRLLTSPPHDKVKGKTFYFSLLFNWPSLGKGGKGGGPGNGKNGGGQNGKGGPKGAKGPMTCLASFNYVHIILNIFWLSRKRW